MNKLKHLLPVLMAAVMAFAIPFAAACKTGNENSDNGVTDTNGGSEQEETVVTQTLQSISVNADNVKKQYYVGEAFTYEGLVVTASVQSSDKTTPDTKTLTAKDYVVDLSGFNRYADGEYTINVSYTLENVTKTGNYSVRVIGNLVDGLDVSLADDATDTYTLTTENPKAKIDTNSIVVKDEEGIAVENYSVKVFNGGDEVEVDNEGYAEASLGGTYQIWAYSNSSVRPGYVCSGFVFVYVINGLTKIELNTENSNAVYEQEGDRSDNMSSTWTFIATYASGATAALTANDVTIGNITTRSAGEYTVTVSYTENSITQSCTVSYTIKSDYAPTTITLDAAEVKDTATFNETTEIIENTIWITASSSSTVTVDAHSKSMDDLNFTHRIKLGGTGKADYRSIKLNLTGAAYITVYGMSSSSGSSRTLALYDSTFSSIDTSFTNDGKAIGKGVFTTSAAGTFYLASTSGGFNVYYIIIEYIG